MKPSWEPLTYVPVWSQQQVQMICIFLTGRSKLSWPECLLRWLDPLVTCVMFIWVDWPMLRFPIEENSNGWLSTVFIPPPFLLWGHHTYWYTISLKVIMALKLEKIQSLIWVEGQQGCFWWEKKIDPLFCTNLLESCQERAEHPPSGIWVGTAASLDQSKSEWASGWAGLYPGECEWYLKALGV